MESVALPKAELRTSWLYQKTHTINTMPSLYLEAGAIHGCVLCKEGRPVCYTEDVGRHNAVDKIAGWIYRHGVDPSDKILYTTGRLTSEMIIKTVRMGIPILVSRSGFTAWGVDLARQVGLTLVGRARGKAALGACIEEAIRASALGVGSVLTADEGVTWALHQLRESGELPDTFQLKISVQSAPANPASFRLMENLGSDTINVPGDLSIEQLAELRASGSASIDFYIEAPDTIGGFVRHYDIAEVIRVAAPVYVKFGLRNAPDIYPSGGHMGDQVVASGIERVRRARLGLDMLARTAPSEETGLLMSPIGARDQAPMTRLVPLR